MTTITVTEALAKLTILGKRIEKATRELPVIITVMGNTPPAGFLSTGDYSCHASSSLDSVLALIAHRDALKAAVVHSNAVTSVTIGGVTMTVAEAIERKTSIGFKKELLSHLRSTYRVAVSNLERQRSIREDKVEANLTVLLGKDRNQTGEQQAAAMKTINDALPVPRLVGHPDLEILIDRLDKEISSFEEEVDIKLSISNAHATIEVD